MHLRQLLLELSQAGTEILVFLFERLCDFERNFSLGFPGAIRASCDRFFIFRLGIGCG
ncbi:hypothetical protein [Methylocaldum sp. RMAD-M]|uniref:hypothetical protein n=1 Tax=Methylocaldum sp. RMAD-M TaxID=2806557 RepID=UPI001FD7BD77|nr:hypothetical protein [Methylocaldum sp. RMAD-M]